MSNWISVLGLALSLSAGMGARGARPQLLHEAMGGDAVEGPAASGLPAKTHEGRRLASSDTVVKLTPAEIQQYVGRYRRANGHVFTIWPGRNELISGETGFPFVFRLHPDARNEFVNLVSDTVDFVRGPHGAVTGMVLHERGRTARAKKISATVPPLPKPAHVPARVLESYVGRYQVTPRFLITIALAGGHLTAKETGHRAVPITPQTQRVFSSHDPDAFIRFSVSPLGKVTGLTLRQAGRRLLALKVK